MCQLISIRQGALAYAISLIFADLIPPSLDEEKGGVVFLRFPKIDTPEMTEV